MQPEYVRACVALWELSVGMQPLSLAKNMLFPPGWRFGLSVKGGGGGGMGGKGRKGVRGRAEE